MAQKKNDCPFCQLADSKETILVHESENFVAILDINPRAKGHTMIIPKKHFGTFEELPKELVAEAFKLAHTVVEKAINGLGAKGASIILNSGTIAGQRIPHVYLQIFPRFEDEETKEVPAGAVFKPFKTTPEELKKIGEQMKSAKFSAEQNVIVIERKDLPPKDRAEEKKGRGKGEKEGFMGHSSGKEEAKEGVDEEKKEGSKEGENELKLKEKKQKKPESEKKKKAKWKSRFTEFV